MNQLRTGSDSGQDVDVIAGRIAADGEMIVARDGYKQDLAV